MAKTKNHKIEKIGKLPVVILPLADYERMKEDLEILQSKKLAKDIEKARKERKLYSAPQVKKILGL